jgi:hypothetical protein
MVLVGSQVLNQFQRGHRGAAGEQAQPFGLFRAEVAAFEAVAQVVVGCGQGAPRDLEEAGELTRPEPREPFDDIARR